MESLSISAPLGKRTVPEPGSPVTDLAPKSGMVSSYAALANPDEGTTLDFMQAPVFDRSTYAKIEKEDVLPEIDYW